MSVRTFNLGHHRMIVALRHIQRDLGEKRTKAVRLRGCDQVTESSGNRCARPVHSGERRVAVGLRMDKNREVVELRDRRGAEGVVNTEFTEPANDARKSAEGGPHLRGDLGVLKRLADLLACLRHQVAMASLNCSKCFSTVSARSASITIRKAASSMLRFSSHIPSRVASGTESRSASGRLAEPRIADGLHKLTRAPTASHEVVDFQLDCWRSTRLRAPHRR